jgi:uncharacterized protein (DUF1778 family)
MKTEKNLSSRIEVRLTSEQKELFENAAQLAGHRSLSDFIVQTIQAKASEVVNQQAAITLSKRDAVMFVDLITNAPKPNAKLKKAYANYRKLSMVAEK